MTRALIFTLATLLLAGCYGSALNQDCVDDFGQTTAAITRQGGWDANGRALFGSHVVLNGMKLGGVVMKGGDAIETPALEGSVLVSRALDGRRISGSDFIGAELSFVDKNGTAHVLRIDGGRPSADDLKWFNYEVSVDGAPVCALGQTGMFVDGSFDARGDHHASSAEALLASYSCEGGAVFKCVKWGHAPWTAGADVHQACTRLARADYCGDGSSFTRDGTPIVQSSILDAPRSSIDEGFEFEAGWGPNGAVCVNKTRYEAFSANGDVVMPSCFANKPRCEDAASAEALGAVLFNASKSQSLTMCE